MRRTILLFALAGLMLVGLGPAAGAAPGSRPFYAVQRGQLTFVPDTNCPAFGLRTNWEAIGNARHLGLSTGTGTHCSDAFVEGAGTLVAANGDELFVEYQVGGPLPTPDMLGETYSVEGPYQIVGGTGRFEGAEGEGHLTVYIVFAGFEAPEWPATQVFRGTIGF